MRLDGKVALISGGSRGQGATEAVLFSQEGASVVIADVLEEEGKKLEAKINESGREARFIRLDVTSEDDWRSAIAETVRSFGKLNILVNNAAIYRRVPIEDTTLDEWNRVMDVNSTGVFLGTKHGHSGDAEGWGRLDHKHFFSSGPGGERAGKRLRRVEGRSEDLHQADGDTARS